MKKLWTSKSLNYLNNLNCLLVQYRFRLVEFTFLVWAFVWRRPGGWVGVLDEIKGIPAKLSWRLSCWLWAKLGNYWKNILDKNCVLRLSDISFQLILWEIIMFYWWQAMSAYFVPQVPHSDNSVDYSLGNAVNPHK